MNEEIQPPKVQNDPREGEGDGKSIKNEGGTTATEREPCVREKLPQPPETQQRPLFGGHRANAKGM